MASEYNLWNRPVAERKEHGIEHREKILAALPATVMELTRVIGRSRACVLHHLAKLGGAIQVDKKEYPHVIRRKL